MMLSTPNTAHRISLLFCLFAGFIPLLAVDIPKSLAFLPAIMGVLFYGLFAFVLKIKLGLSKNALFLGLIIFGMAVISLIWAKDFDVTLRQALRFSALLPPLVILISLVSRIPREIILPYIRYYPYAIALASLLIILEILWGGILFNLVRGLPLNNTPQIFEYNRAAVLLAFKRHYKT
jgi:hypothetical protein